MTQQVKKSQMDENKITCQICGELTHHIGKHLKDSHGGSITIDQYRIDYPDAPVMSEMAREAIERRNAEKLQTNMAGATVTALKSSNEKRAFNEVFGFGDNPAAMNSRGNPIMITIHGDKGANINSLIPKKDNAYIFNIDILKSVMMALELNVPMLLWGLHGSGKTTLIQQYCAAVNRAAFRVQHTVSTEEAHIVGQYVVRNGGTEFELGPLPYAMRHGLVYIADEYDFALPNVIATYQPVLEGQALVIKEAPIDMRVIEPHPDFRFVATGNTNGSGDETGLYQGTNIQNAAAYSRFGVTRRVDYMPEEQEVGVLMNQAGIAKQDAANLVDFAKRVRQQYEAGEISLTVSPRELINAATLGMAMGSKWREGLQMAFINRLGRTDLEAVDQTAQRIFG